jgi:hypothetical protein
MTQTRTTTSSPPGPGAGGVIAAVGIGVAIAVGVGVGLYAVWRSSRPQPANVSMGDLSRLGGAPSAKVVGREIAQFRPGFQRARAITVAPNGEIYVTGDFAIRRFDSAGKQLAEIAAIEPPGAVAVDANGDVYATFGNKVWVFDHDGKRIATWPARENAVLTSIAVCDAGVLVADYGGRCVLRYDGSGKVVKVIGKKDEARNCPGFVVPSPYFDLAMAPDGLLRVTNPGRHQIETYTLDGDRGAAWGRFSGTEPDGFVGCCNPANFAIVPAPGRSGDFAGFVTAEKGLARVKVFDADGKFVGLLAPPDMFARHDELVAAGPSGEPFTALDVAAGAAGRIYVLDGVVGLVHVFEWKPEKKGLNAENAKSAEKTSK